MAFTNVIFVAQAVRLFEDPISDECVEAAFHLALALPTSIDILEVVVKVGVNLQ